MVSQGETGSTGFSRRTVIAGTAGIAAGHAFSSSAAASRELTVMTRNLALGVELFDVTDANSMEEMRQVAGRLFEDFVRYPFDARAEAIAAEIEATDPDVVGLQEAALIRTRRPSDFDVDEPPSASDVVVDFLEVLSSRLDDRGLEYEVATSRETTDIEVPADVDDGRIDVRLTDRVALLVREDVEIGDTGGDVFEAVRPIPFGGDETSIRRGYCTADVTVGGEDVTVATTHLESSRTSVRERQAEELIDVLPADRPVVLAGDFNSGPGGSRDAYDLLADRFDDAHATLRPDEDGFTCCQDEDLRNEESQLSRRIDGVLYRGGPEPTAIERVGTDPDDRVLVETEDGSVRLWPSDHAGVVASLEVSTESESGRESSANDSRQDASNGEAAASDQLPGFGFAAAVVAIVLALLRRRERSD